MSCTHCRLLWGSFPFWANIKSGSLLCDLVIGESNVLMCEKYILQILERLIRYVYEIKILVITSPPVSLHPHLPTQFICWNSNPHHGGIGTFGSWSGLDEVMRVGPSWDHCKKRDAVASLSFLLPLWLPLFFPSPNPASPQPPSLSSCRHRKRDLVSIWQKSGHMQPRWRTLTRNWPHWCLNFRFLASRSVKNKFLLFKPFKSFFVQAA